MLIAKNSELQNEIQQKNENILNLQQLSIRRKIPEDEISKILFNLH